MSPHRRKTFLVGATLLAGAIAALTWTPRQDARRDTAPQNTTQPAFQSPAPSADAPAPVKPASVPPAAEAAVPASAPASTTTTSVNQPGSAKLSDEALSAQFRALRRDLNWKKEMPEPEMAQFADWTRRYTNTPAQQRGQLLAEGVQLATTRRIALAKLIETNPTRALEVAVPVAVRRQMPIEVENLLEKDVNGRGDLMVEAGTPMPGPNAPKVRAVRRTTIINGDEYETYVGPRREGQPSRARIPIHGIAVEGKLAASDYPGRAVEPVEAQEAKSALGIDPTCSVSGLETTAKSDESVIDVAGGYRFFCGANHAMQELQGLATDESNLPLGYGFDVAASAYTEGVKRLLIIRVDFTDYPGAVAPDKTLTDLVVAMKSFWEDMSYGKTSWQLIADKSAGLSAMTPTLRLPLPSSNYTSLGSLRTAARTAAKNAGYVLTNYDFDMIVTKDKPDAGFAGVGYVGAPGCWLANGYWLLQVASHELGHNFGLNHANSWDTTDGTVIGDGSSTEYGDPYDTMGVAANEARRHYNSRYKNYLNWLTSTEVQTISSSGTYRVFAHDIKTATGIRGLRIARTPASGDPATAQNYWIDARDQFSDNRWLNNGVFVHWTHNGNSQANLLDTTPKSANGKDDAALVVGRTLSDPQGIHITPIAKNPGTPASSYDVVVNLGTFPSNHVPTLSVVPSLTTAARGQNVTFTATATDLDNDTLAYYWEFLDGNFGGNSPTVTRSFSSNSEQLVRCTVTDMKGGTATASVLVKVGTPTTYNIVGMVSNDVGGVGGVLVSAGSKSTTTDSDGTYILVGLTAGSYTVTASDPVKIYLPVGFTNPVVIPPSGKAINFGTAPATPTMSALPPLMLNINTQSGTLPLTVTDKDTPLDKLTLSATSNNVALVAGKDVVFGGTLGNRTVSVTPGTNQTGVAVVTVTVSDPQGNSSSMDWVINVNAPPTFSFPLSIRGDEDTVLDIDLANYVADVPTDDAGLLFEVSGGANGAVSLLPDGHTARFTPDKDVNGAASFQLAVTDQSSEPRLFLYYSFEGPDTLTDGKAMDRSNFARDGSLEVIGGGEISYAINDSPPGTGLYNAFTLGLAENINPDDPTALAAARLSRSIATSELNFSTQSWTFATWFERKPNGTDDIILHIGDGTGAGTTDQLQVICPANSSTVALQHLGAGGMNINLSAPIDLDASPWHHVAVVHTGGAARMFEFYVDGVKAGEISGVTVNMSQTVPVVFGGHNSTTIATDKYWNGKLDEIAIWSAALTGSEVGRVSKVIVPHFSGVTKATQVNLSLSSVNDAPIISAITEQALDEDTSLTVPFSVSDDSTPVASIAIRASSSNPGLIPSAGLVLAGSTGARTLKITPAADAAGSAVITITAGDGLLESTREFVVNVRQINDGPAISTVANTVLPEDGTAVLLPFDVSDRDTPAVDLTVTATSSNQSLIPDASLQLSGTGVRRAVSVTPAADASGIATITLTVSDGALSASTQFTVTVGTSNDAPTIGIIANQTTTPGTAVGPIAFTVADAETAAGQITVSAKSSNPKLLPDTAIVLGGKDGDRTVTLQPTAGATGSATVTLFASDGTLKTVRSFLLVAEGEGNLRVVVSGEGTVSPGFIGKSQRVPGQSYTIAAAPKPGFAFAGWTGGITSPQAKLTFTMTDSMELQANFVPSPFDTLKGQWNGLAEDLPATHGGTGLISLKVLPAGSFTGSVTLGGVKTPLKGAIKADGSTGDLTINRKNASPLKVALQFGGTAGINRMDGTIVAGDVTSEVHADLAVFTAAKTFTAPQRHLPAAWLGKYTFAIEDSDSASKVGSAYATLTVLPTGVVRGVGKLADGTSFTYSNSLSGDGTWPFYLSLYKGGGAIAGWINWSLKDSSDLDGPVRWFKPVGVGSAALAGWVGPMECEAIGSLYNAPSASRNGLPAVPALPMLVEPGVTNDFQASFTLGAQELAQPVVLTVDGKLSVTEPPSNTSRLKLSLQAATGIVTGTFFDSAGQKHQSSGVLLQRANRGTGFHLAPTSSGPFRIQKPVK